MGGGECNGTKAKRIWKRTKKKPLEKDLIATKILKLTEEDK